MEKKKCESCKSYEADPKRRGFGFGTCASQQVMRVFCQATSPMTYATLGIGLARELCDREGDGHFVYFEPKDPESGSPFVQPTREASASIAAGA
jgi:hypothetical protein